MGNILSRHSSNQNILSEALKLNSHEKERINEYLNNVYEESIKIKRSVNEVQSIKSAVDYVVAELMAAVRREEPLYEVVDQYLVGSMAEGTRIKEPDEFDFIVAMKHLQTKRSQRYKHQIRDTILGIPGRSYVFSNGNQIKYVKYNFLFEILSKVLAVGTDPFRVKTDHGILLINSKTVCHHGPATAIKLLWNPTSDSGSLTSKPLDILIDITPCVKRRNTISTVSTPRFQFKKYTNAFV